MHLTNETLSRYAAGNLPSTDFLSADDHLAECEVCRLELAASQGIEAKSAHLKSEISNAEASDHLRYEDLESFVDGNINEVDREIIESHLEFCRQCKEQVAELKSLKVSLSERGGIGRKIRTLWISPEYSTLFRTISLAAIFALFALMLSLLNHRPDQNMQAQLQNANNKLNLAKQRIEVLNHQVAQLKKPAHQESAPMVASLHDSNGIIGVDDKGQLIGADAFPTKYKELAQAAFNQKQLPIPKWLETMQGQSSVLMGESTNGLPIRLIAPLGEVTASTRPGFQWKALAGVSKYRVSVYDQNFRTVAASETLETTSWTPRSDLPRGAIYTWKITAMKNGQEITSPIPPAPEAKFKILDQEKFDEISELRKPNSHLLLALAYSDAGMIREAESELEALSKENSDSPLAADLLKSLTNRRGERRPEASGH